MIKNSLFFIVIAFGYWTVHAMELSFKDRLEMYNQWLLDGVGFVSGEDIHDPLVQRRVLIANALGRMLEGKHAPDEEAVVYWVQNRIIDPCAYRNRDGQTLLHDAVFWNAPRVVHYLLFDEQVYLHQDCAGRTPLHIAAHPHGGVPHKEIIEMLLERDDQLVHQGDLVARTPLFYIDVETYPEIGDVLLQAGAHVDHSDVHGNTPLFFAHNEARTKFFCSRGAYVDEYDGCKMTPLVRALYDYQFHQHNFETSKNLESCRQTIFLEKKIKQLIWYGALIPSAYHPAVYSKEIGMGESESIRTKRRILRRIMRDMLTQCKEHLVFVKNRKTSISPELVFDRCAALQRFFRARAMEWKTIFPKMRFNEFMARLLSLGILPDQVRALERLAEDMIHNDDYDLSTVFCAEEKKHRGALILSKVFPEL